MIKLELTIEEVNFALAALGKQPFDTVAGLIDKIRGQAIPQVQEAQAAEAPAPEASE